MSTKGGPDFTFSLPGWRLAPMPPVSYATVHNGSLETDQFITDHVHNIPVHKRQRS